MPFSLQMFGNISAPSGQLGAMLCRDADRPHEVMIHWFGLGDPVRPQAGLFKLVPQEEHKYKADLLLLFDRNSIGALMRASPEQHREAESYVVMLEEVEHGVKGTWSVQGEGEGEIEFFSTDDSRPGGLSITTCRTWDDFKRWATDLRGRTTDPAFRGHGWSEWPLQTTSYRSGLTRLERYYDETLQQFRHHAEATLDVAFDLSNPNDYSTLLGLAQHHGLPTPLLDFTSSPYVAAYFAFADAVENKRAIDGFVRVYAIDGEFLSHFSPSLVPLATVEPYIASLTISARRNPRLYAQQGKFLVTNVGNLERYLIGLRNLAGVQREFLFIADVPIQCAAEALTDLKYMGLTAATLFPGLDGVCRMMRQEITLKAQSEELDLLPVEGASLEDQPGALPSVEASDD